MALSEQEQQLLRDIRSRRAAIVDDLRRLVGLPTGGNNIAAIEEARSMLVDRLAALGANTTTVPGDPKPAWLHRSGTGPAIPASSLSSRPRPSRPRLLLCGHLDTVHPPRPVGSDFTTLEISPDGARGRGPGCADMKGGLVVALHSLESLENLGCPVSWSFLLNADEETGSYHSASALDAAARVHDVGLIVEPAPPDGSLLTSRGGSGQFAIDVRGRSAHVGRDFAKGVSAVNELARHILSVASLSRPAEGMIASIGPIDGGSTTNSVPERARAWGNLRFETDSAANALVQSLMTLRSTPGDSSPPQTTVECLLHRPPKPETPEVLALARAARAASEDLGNALPFGRSAGVCDGNNLQAAGLPTLDTLGVLGGDLHTAEEHVDLESLPHRCALLAVLILRLSQESPGSATA